MVTAVRATMATADTASFTPAGDDSASTSAPPERLPTLVLGNRKRFGRIDAAEIPQLGESIESLAQSFELPPKIDEHLLPPARPSAPTGS